MTVLIDLGLRQGYLRKHICRIRRPSGISLFQHLKQENNTIIYEVEEVFAESIN